MIRTLPIGVVLAAAIALWNSHPARYWAEEAHVPALKTYAAAAELPHAPPFDVVGVFTVTIHADGSTHDVDLLVVKPADSATRAEVPPAVAAEVAKAGAEALRNWRYELSTTDARVRVTFSWFVSSSRSPKAPPRRVTAVEACLPEVQAAKPAVVPFLANVGHLQRLEDVSLMGGPEDLHKAARTILDQWRFSDATEQTRLQSVLRFFPADCHVAGW